MLMCKILLHIKAIKNILNNLEQLKVLGHKIITAIMNDMDIYAECIKFHAISTFLKKITVE